MKKNLAIFLLAGAIGCVLTGCDHDDGTAARINVSSKNAALPEITVYADGWNIPNMNYYYVVDENTGVVYIECDGMYRHGITVAFNADGTVMTKKDILKEGYIYGTNGN